MKDDKVMNVINGKIIKVKNDWWRRGIMKRIPLLLSLSIIILIGVMLTIFLR